MLDVFPLKGAKQEITTVMVYESGM